MSSTTANNKRIAKNTLFLYFRMLLLMVVSLYTSRVILHALGSVDYGLNNVIAGVIAMFVFLKGSMSTSTSRFIAYELGRQDYKRLGEIFNNSFGIHVGFSIIILFIAETFGLWFVNHVLNIPENRLVACNIVYQIAVASSILHIILVPRNAMIIAYERMNIYAFVSIIDAMIKLGIAYLIFYLDGDKLIMLVFLRFLSDIFHYLFYWYYCNKKFPQVCRLSLHYSKEIIRSLLGFTTWNFIGSLAVMARSHGVTILINIFFGAVVNAANAIAYQVNSAITHFTSNFSVALNPQIIKTYASGEHEAMKKIIYRGGRFSFYLLIILCYPVLFETDYILGLWLGKYPEYTVLFTRLVLILSMIEIFNQSVGCAVQATGKIRYYQIVISGIQLFTLPFTWFIYEMGMPPYSALIIMNILGLTAVIARLYFIQNLLQISALEYFKEVLFKCAYISILTSVVPYVIRHNFEPSLVRFVILTVGSSLSSAFIIMTFGVSRGERTFILNAVRKIIKL